MGNDLDRERIACVFGLGGGELHVADERFTDEWDGANGIAYWYEGVPDYATELKRLDEARTAILDCMYGFPEPPDGWEQVASFSSSGEAECWWCAAGEVGDDVDTGGNGAAKTACKLCDGDGIVYLGDGWCEVVYARRYPVDVR